MRISSKGDYGLRALFDLAQRFGQGPIQSEEIAQRQGIPVNYLNQLLIVLRRAGLIESLRGPLGGHMLARRPETSTTSSLRSKGHSCHPNPDVMILRREFLKIMHSSMSCGVNCVCASNRHWPRSVLKISANANVSVPETPCTTSKGSGMGCRYLPPGSLPA